MARQVKFSQGVRAAYDIRCPETRIEVETERVFGSDRVYVLDACGTKVELEHGLRIPASLTEIDPLSNEEIAELRQTLTFPHQALTALVQQEVRVWCREGDALVRGETPEQCHARLAATLIPLGRGRHARDAEEHWFIIDHRVFRAWAELARPPCEHLVLSDTPLACDCRGEAHCSTAPKGTAVAKRRKSPDTAQAEASFPELYGRVELGGGYANLRVAENSRFPGVGIVEAAFLGVALAPPLTLTAGLSGFNGIVVEPYSRTVCTDGFCGAETGQTDIDHYAIWFRSNVYPFGSSLHLDAGAGFALGLQRFVIEESPEPAASPARIDVRGGPALSLGAGYEGLIGDRWFFGLGGRQIWFVASELRGTATEGFVTIGMRVD